jgi:hypothetical protein
VLDRRAQLGHDRTRHVVTGCHLTRVVRVSSDMLCDVACIVGMPMSSGQTLLSVNGLGSIEGHRSIEIEIESTGTLKIYVYLFHA